MPVDPEREKKAREELLKALEGLRARPKQQSAESAAKPTK